MVHTYLGETINFHITYKKEKIDAFFGGFLREC